MQALIVLIVAAAIVCGVLATCASMRSSQISRIEERRERER